MRAGRVAALVGGALAAMAAVGLVLGGTALGVVHVTQRGDDGFYTAPAEHLHSEGYTITAEHLDLMAEAREGHWVPGIDFGSARVTARSTGGGAVFVGVARQADVDAFLAGSAHDELTDAGALPSREAYRAVPGDERPRPRSESRSGPRP